MKIIFIALVIALTSSSLLVQEQAGSVVPESQKRDITVPSVNGAPLHISYAGKAGSVKVDGKKLANSNRHLDDDDSAPADDNTAADGGDGSDGGDGADGDAVMDIAPEDLTGSDEVIEMSPDDVATEELTNLAGDILDNKDSTLVQRGNAILILLTPTASEDAEASASDDHVLLSRDQANDIKAVIALLLANVPDDALVQVQAPVPLDEVPEAVDVDDSAEVEAESRRRLRNSRRAKALRRVSRLRAVRRRRHRAMSIRNHAATRNHKVATTFGKRRVLRLGAPHFVRYNTPVTHNRHLVGTPAPKVEAQGTTPVAENKEVV